MCFCSVCFSVVFLVNDETIKENVSHKLIYIWQKCVKFFTHGRRFSIIVNSFAENRKALRNVPWATYFRRAKTAIKRRVGFISSKIANYAFTIAPVEGLLSAGVLHWHDWPIRPANRSEKNCTPPLLRLPVTRPFKRSLRRGCHDVVCCTRPFNRVYRGPWRTAVAAVRYRVN